MSLGVSRKLRPFVCVEKNAGRDKVHVENNARRYKGVVENLEGITISDASSQPDTPAAPVASAGTKLTTVERSEPLR